MANQIKIVKISLSDYERLKNAYPNPITIKGEEITWDPTAGTVYVNPDASEKFYTADGNPILHVSTVTIEYALSDSETSCEESHLKTDWSIIAPAHVDSYFMWQRTTTYYTTSLVPTITETCIQGAKGNTGATGATGAKGDTGATGPQGQSVTMKTDAEYCTAIGDTYIEKTHVTKEGKDMYGHLMYLSDLNPITFRDCGKVIGEDGISAYRLDIANDFDSIPCSSDGTPKAGYDWATKTKHDIKAYLGTQQVSIGQVYATLPATIEDDYILIYKLDGIPTDKYVSDGIASGAYSAHITGLSADIGTIYYTMYDKDKKALCTSKFEAAKLIAGTDGTDGIDGEDAVDYWLVPTFTNIKVDKEKHKYPAEITFNFYKQIGSQTPTTPELDYTYKIDDKAIETGKGTSLTLNTANITRAVTVTIYNNAEHTVKYDSETVAVIEDGIGISTVIEYYRVTATEDKPSKEPLSDWDNTIPEGQPSEETPFLWNFERIYNSASELTKDTEPVILCRWTKDGKGISSIEEYYKLTNTVEKPEKSETGWTTEPQQVTSTERYLWNYEIINYTEGDPTETEVNLLAAFGEKGETGPAGKDGTSVQIKGEVAKWADLASKAATAAIGDGYIVEDAADDPVSRTITKGVLYTYSGNNIWAYCGQIRGPEGTTPHIGEDKYWYIGTTKTDVKAEGEDGEPGDTPYVGANGNWWIGTVDTGVYAEGKSAYTISIDNDFDSVPCDKNGNPQYTAQEWIDETSHTIEILYGAKKQSFEVFSATEELQNGLCITYTPSDVTYVKGSTHTTVDTYTAYVTGFENNKDVGSITYTLYLDKKVVGYSKFEVSKIKAGQDGQPAEDYKIMSSDSSIVYNKEAGTLVPSSITFSFKKKVGSADYTDYEGYYSYTIDNGDAITGSGKNVVIDSYTSTNSKINIVLYSDSERTKKLDSETVLIVRDGAKGDQGVPGQSGTDGRTYYTWIKYADALAEGKEYPDVMYDKPKATTEFIGLAYNKTTQTEGTVPSEYTWSNFKGNEGTAGRSIAEIKNYYVAWATNTTADAPKAPASEYPEVGWQENTIPALSTEKQYLYNYEESYDDHGQLIGDHTEPGIIGKLSKDGKGISEVIEEYAINNNKDTAPTEGWSTDVKTVSETNKYLWNREKMKYSDGTIGPATKPVIIGTFGESGYTWIKYAHSITPTSEEMDDNPVDPYGKAYEYIGLSYNNKEKTESTDPSKYKWSKYVGEDGQDGADGTDGINAYNVVIDNDFVSVPCNSDKEPIWTTEWSTKTEHTMTVLCGGTSQEFKLSKTVPTTASTDLVLVVDYTTAEVTYYPTTLPTGLVSSFKAYITNLLTDTGDVNYTLYRGTTKISSGKFEATKLVPGADGDAAIHYWIDSSDTQIKVSDDGTFTPTTVTFNFKQQSGTNAIEDFYGYYKILVDGTVKKESKATTAKTVSVSSADFTKDNKKITAELYRTYSSTVYSEKCDSETILLVKDGKGVGSIINFYQLTNSTDKSSLDPKSWTACPPGTIPSPTSSNKYLWNFERTCDGSGATINDTTPNIIVQYTKDGKGINTIVDWYKSANSTPETPTSPSSQGWSTDPNAVPMSATATHLYKFEVITYTDLTVTTTPIICIGNYAKDGNGISDTEIRYAQTETQVDPTTIAEAEWKPDIPTVTDGWYLWTRTKIIYTDTTTKTTYNYSRDPEDGKAGKGISGTEIRYQEGTSGTTPPTGTWTEYIPTVSEGNFLWTRVVTSYTEGSPSTTYSVSKIGTNGTDGKDGKDGTPALIYSELIKNDDLNTKVTKDYCYFTGSTEVCNSLKNTPSGFPAGELRMVIEWCGLDNYFIQHLYCKDSLTNKEYTRNYSGTIFTAWEEKGKNGVDGNTPYIGNNGHWWISTTDTGTKAEGTDGNTPYVGTNGNWWIGTTDTGVKAAGTDGRTPTIVSRTAYYYSDDCFSQIKAPTTTPGTTKKKDTWYISATVPTTSDGKIVYHSMNTGYTYTTASEAVWTTFWNEPTVIACAYDAKGLNILKTANGLFGYGQGVYYASNKNGLVINGHTYNIGQKIDETQDAMASYIAGDSANRINDIKVYIDAEYIKTGAFTVKPSGATDPIFEAGLSAGTVKIGGFEVNNTALKTNGYISSYSETPTTNGVYVGSDGIKLGKYFSVDANGAATASSITLTGYPTTDEAQSMADTAESNATTASKDYADDEISKEKSRAEGIETSLNTKAQTGIDNAATAQTKADSAYTLATGKSTTIYATYDELQAKITAGYTPQAGDCWFCTADSTPTPGTEHPTEFVDNTKYYFAVPANTTVPTSFGYISCSSITDIPASWTGYTCTGAPFTGIGYGLANGHSRLTVRIVTTTDNINYDVDSASQDFNCYFIYSKTYGYGDITPILQHTYSLVSKHKKDTLYQYNNNEWKDIGGQVVAKNVTAEYINSKHITAEKIDIIETVGTETKHLFTADGLSGAHTVNIGGFEVDYNSLSINVEEQDGKLILTNESVLLSTGTGNTASIGGSDEKSGWAILAGKTFGVNRDGNMYASAGLIGGFTITGYDETAGTKASLTAGSGTDTITIAPGSITLGEGEVVLSPQNTSINNAQLLNTSKLKLAVLDAEGQSTKIGLDFMATALVEPTSQTVTATAKTTKLSGTTTYVATVTTNNTLFNQTSFYVSQDFQIKKDSGGIISYYSKSGTAFVTIDANAKSGSASYIVVLMLGETINKTLGSPTVTPKTFTDVRNGEYMATINGSFAPATTDKFNLGSADNEWYWMYTANAKIYNTYTTYLGKYNDKVTTAHIKTIGSSTYPNDTAYINTAYLKNLTLSAQSKLFSGNILAMTNLQNWWNDNGSITGTSLSVGETGIVMICHRATGTRTFTLPSTGTYSYVAMWSTNDDQTSSETYEGKKATGVSGGTIIATVTVNVKDYGASGFIIYTRTA